LNGLMMPTISFTSILSLGFRGQTRS